MKFNTDKRRESEKVRKNSLKVLKDTIMDIANEYEKRKKK